MALVDVKYKQITRESLMKSFIGDTSDTISTRRLLNDGTPLVNKLDLQPRKTNSLGLKLYIPMMTEPCTVGHDETVMLGRTTEGDEEKTRYVDLTEYQAKLLGVSRQHATIVALDGQYYIKDMCSTNSTMVNGQRLAPYQMYPIRYGDELRLGHMVITVG